MNLYEFEIVRQRVAQALQASLHAPRYLDRIGVALLVDRQFDRLLAAHTRNRLALLEAAPNAGDIAQVDGTVGDVADDRVAELFHALEFVERADEEPLVAFFEPAARQVDVLGTNPRRDFVDANAELRKFLLVDPDLDFVLEPAADLDGRRPFLRLEIGLDAVLGEASQRFEILLRSKSATVVLFLQQAEAHDRLGRRVEAQ